MATDRGGGNVSVTNSAFATAGSGSPLLYSTGDIEVSGVTGTASGSQICGMEGLNTILIDNSTLKSTNDAISGSDPVRNGVIIYQSTSGDAESTTGQAATFQATDSTLSTTISSGAMFYLTNTEANIILSNTTLDFDSSNVDLLMAEGNDSNNWGTSGSNGAQVNFTGIGEILSGNIDVDTISSVDLYLLDESTYSGTTTISTNATNTSVQDSNLIMNVDGTSKWVVTGDSTVDELNVADGGQVVDAQGNTVTVIADGATVVSGTSPYTVIVNDSYSTTVSTSDTNAVQSAGVDRSGFDSYYGTSTAFLTDGVSAATSQNASTASTSTSAKTTLESVISAIDSLMTSKAS